MTLSEHLIHTATLGTSVANGSSPERTLIDIARYHLTRSQRLYRTKQRVHMPIMARQRYLTDEAIDCLRVFGKGCYREVLPEWVNYAEIHGLVVPPHHLPEVLNMGYNLRYMRLPLMAIIGPHGIWLANTADDRFWEWVLYTGDIASEAKPSSKQEAANRAQAPTEKELIRHLTRRSTGLYNDHPALRSLIYGRQHTPWSEPLGEAVISSLRQHLHSRTRRQDDVLREEFDTIVARMPLTLRKQLLAVLGGRLNDARRDWRGMIYTARAIFDFRVRMLAILERC